MDFSFTTIYRLLKSAWKMSVWMFVCVSPVFLMIYYKDFLKKKIISKYMFVPIFSLKPWFFILEI